MKDILHICVVTGARPNFIKVAPLIWAVKNNPGQFSNIKLQLVYTGSQDDMDVEPTVLSDLAIPQDEVVFLGIVSNRINELTGLVMNAFDRYLDQHPTDAVVVVDDLASTMAAAIVTKKRGLTLAHLVAGTRSFNINMPKEINRLVIDGLSDLLFTAGDGGNCIASREGADPSKVFIVGNVLIDTLRHHLGKMEKPGLLDQLQLKDQGYIAFTLNRKALIADKAKLGALLEPLLKASTALPVIAILRKKAMEAVAALLPAHHPHFHLAEPLGYRQFLYLTAHAQGIVTDSGNVAEEATFNHVPCITLNSYTEHIETVKEGTNVLVGEDPQQLQEALQQLAQGTWKEGHLPDRWDGRSAERILRILSEEIQKHH